MDTSGMLLRVGELARRTGLTVRALHHYDSIGLLHPTGRSDSGYRLYGRDDVARLHGIQTLRRMGLSLADVAQLLDGGAVTLPAILARQIGVLDQQIAQAQALRERLSVMQSIIVGGGQPEIDDWLVSLSMMNTFEQYFSAGELKLVFERWKRCKSEWPPLVQAVRESMERGVPPDSIELQPPARRWMDVSARWMDGDLALLKRWGSMLREQPGLPLPSGMDSTLLEYINQPVQSRLAACQVHQCGRAAAPGQDTGAGVARVRRTRRALDRRRCASARQLASDWQNLADRLVRHDGALRERLLAAYDNEPLLQAGAVFTPEVRHYVRQAAGGT